MMILVFKTGGLGLDENMLTLLNVNSKDGRILITGNLCKNPKIEFSIWIIWKLKFMSSVTFRARILKKCAFWESLLSERRLSRQFRTKEQIIVRILSQTIHSVLLSSDFYNRQNIVVAINFFHKFKKIHSLKA